MKFETITVWANKHGLELTHAGALQFDRIIATDNTLSQFVYGRVSTGEWDLASGICYFI